LPSKKRDSGDLKKHKGFNSSHGWKLGRLDNKKHKREYTLFMVGNLGSTITETTKEWQKAPSITRAKQDSNRIAYGQTHKPNHRA